MRFGGDGVIVSFLFAVFAAACMRPLSWFLSLNVPKETGFGKFKQGNTFAEMMANRDETGLVRRDKNE